MIAKFGKPLLACAGAAALMLTMGAGGSLALNDDDELGAGIHEGTCASPGAMIEDIDDLEIDDDRRTPTIAGTAVAGPVYEEDEDLDVSLETLTGAPHVVLVRASDDSSAPAVACGEITGEPTNGTLRVPLAEVDGSGITGVATFRPDDDDDDDDDDELEVLIQVHRGGGMASTPAA